MLSYIGENGTIALIVSPF